LELCVDPQIELCSTEFDSYIRNKWEWRDSFILSNSSYAITGSMVLGSIDSAISSSWSSGSYLEATSARLKTF
jgi:hypothetical protein